MNEINPEYSELVFDAASKAYWFKKSFRAFLLTCGVSEQTLATWAPQETKKDFLLKLFERIQKAEKGPIVLAKMANVLSEKEHYPDLVNSEDSSFKIKTATDARDRLRIFLEKKRKFQQEEADAAVRRAHAHALSQSIKDRVCDLEKLEGRFYELAKDLGQQKAGYDFQNWFYEMMSHFEVTHRRPYQTGGRQIDGSISINGTHYLVELKFTSDQSPATDVDSLASKVRNMADNTMGILVSVSGYSSVALTEASKSKVLLLLDVNHLFLALKSINTFPQIVERIRRHAAQTGEAYLPANDFGH